MKRIIIYMSIIIVIILLLSSIKLLNKKTIDNNKITVKLDKCVDGDTAWFKINGAIKKYRFLSIDSPEIDTEYGKLAKDYVCDLLMKSKDIKIEYDKLGETKDKYEIELVWVYVDNELLQEKILEKGLAEIKYVYAKYAHLDKLIEIENSSKNNKIGIWKNYYNKTYNEYYTITLDNLSVITKERVLKNNMIIINNPIKKGCKFIGWQNNNKLFDLSTKIKKDYKLVAKFEC